jgi:hypothetical protein
VARVLQQAFEKREALLVAKLFLETFHRAELQQGLAARFRWQHAGA